MIYLRQQILHGIGLMIWFYLKKYALMITRLVPIYTILSVVIFSNCNNGYRAGGMFIYICDLIGCETMIHYFSSAGYGLNQL